MNKKIILIVISAFVLRLAALILLGRHVNPERWEYDYIAVNLIQHHGYVFWHLNTTYHTYAYPVYALLTAVFHLLTNYNYFILELFQISLSAFSCYFIYLISEIIFDKKTGLIAAILVATHPGLIVYSTKLSEVTLIIFLLSLTFLLILKLDMLKVRNNILLGLLIGIGMLTRPLAVFFLPVYGLYAWFSAQRKRVFFRVISVVSLSAALAITPWTIRNYLIHKRFIFITTNTPEYFWRGNNPQATGTALRPDKQDIMAVAPQEFKDKLFKMNEIQQYDFFMKTAWEHIKSDPLFFVKMCFKKFLYFWWFTPTIGILYPDSWTLVYKIYYSVIFILFIVGCIASLIKLKGIKKISVVSLFGFFFLTSLLHSIYYLETRHRLSIEPLLLIFSSYGFILLWGKLRFRR